MFAEKKLERWVDGVRGRVALPLRLELWNGRQFDFAPEPPRVTVRVLSASALACFLRPSLSSLGAAYVDGKIDIQGKGSEIVAVGSALASQAAGTANRMVRLFRRNRHSKQRDAEAIRYHYDVSNDFYKLWLDERMVYSCAYFEDGDEDLDAAQLKKIDHILTKIRLQPGQSLLDIGCGWGALVIRAAQKFGAHCVGITLSERQAELARQRVHEAGLDDRVEIRLQDYRDVDGRFDRITSVGMFEHVGLDNLPAYFSRINALLADGGVVMNHGITSTDANSGDSPFGGGEFIDRYVFPNGELPHISLVLRTMQESGLEALDIENLRRHYARTCAIWAERFERHGTTIRDLAGELRYRIWRLYLAGCAHGFAADWIALYQVVCVKANGDASRLPWSRRYMYPARDISGH